MQPAPTHHWYSSILTGLCVVGGFGLGMLWHEQRMSASISTELPALAQFDSDLCSDLVYCAAVDDADDAKQDSKEKKKSRAWRMPRGLTDEQMKKVEEALQRARDALEKEGMELPEDFQRHMKELQKRMQEHQKLLERQMEDFNFKFKDWDGLESLEDLPKKLERFRDFRMPQGAPGAGVSIVLNREDGNYQIERREGTLSIRIEGNTEDKEQVKSIVIKDGSATKKYMQLKDVPAAHRQQVKELIEMGSSGRVMVRPHQGKDQPKKAPKDADEKPEREFY